MATYDGTRAAPQTSRKAMKRLLITAAALCALAGAAQAQDRPPMPVNPDTDHDGKITWSEYQAMSGQRMSRMFARMDANHDGKVTEAEVQAARAARSGQAPAGGPGRGGGFLLRADANHDGAVSKAEFDAMSKARFDAADTNHDGWLSKGEMILMRQRMGGGEGRPPE